MTTGATRFTRMAGWFGVVGLALGVAAFFAAVTGGGPSPGGGGYLLLLVAFGCGIVFLAGLIARHRGLWWTGAVTWVLLGGIAIGVVGFLGEAGAFAVLGTWLSGLAIASLLLGAFLAGELPRGALFLVLVTAVTRDHGFLAFVGGLIGFVGYVRLAIAMASEPLGEDVGRDAWAQMDSRAGIA